LFTAEREKAGVLTSYQHPEDYKAQILGLGLIRTDCRGMNLEYSASDGRLDGRAEFLSEQTA
jgi:hypothetical protein